VFFFLRVNNRDVDSMDEVQRAERLAIACVRGVESLCCGAAIGNALVAVNADFRASLPGLMRSIESLSRWAKELWELAEGDTGRAFVRASVRLPHDERFSPSGFGRAAWLARKFFGPVNLAICEAFDWEFPLIEYYPDKQLLGRVESLVSDSSTVASAFRASLYHNLSNDESRDTEFDSVGGEVLVNRIRMEAALLSGDPSPLEPDDVTLKVQKNSDVATIKSLLVHVSGFSEHGKSYGKSATEQVGLRDIWRPMRYALRQQGFGGESDREVIESFLDYLEFDRGLKRAEVLDSPLAEWRRFFLPEEKEPQTGAADADPLPPGADSGDSDAGESPLAANDRFILQAMLEMNADVMHPRSAREIVRAAVSTGDEKRAFDNLKRNGLVKSKQGRCGGYWLTQKGKEAAEELTKRELR
jgi:hypothetical protein